MAQTTQKDKPAYTDAQMAQWKKEHGDKVRVLTVNFEGKEVTGVFRKPSLDDIMSAEDAHPDDQVKQNLMLAKVAFLGGDKEVKTEDEVRYAMGNAVASMFKILKAEVKKP